MKAHREVEHNRTQFQIDRIAFFSDIETKSGGGEQDLILWQLTVQAPDKGNDIILFLA